MNLLIHRIAMAAGVLLTILSLTELFLLYNQLLYAPYAVASFVLSVWFTRQMSNHIFLLKFRRFHTYLNTHFNGNQNSPS